MTPGEQKVIYRVLVEALRAGFRPVGVYDGEEMQRGEQPRMMTGKEVISACASVDDSHIHFVTERDGKTIRAWARVILGNARDGSEVIADNSMTPGFAEAIEVATA